VEDINKAAGADVQATAVNVGSSAAPDYRLSIQMKKLAASTVQLEYTDGNGTTQTVLDQLASGAPARYEVNGSSITSTSDSRSITLAPGLTVQLLKETEAGEPVTITVSRDTAAISNALSSFVNAYNSVAGELNLHRGSNHGALAGNSIIGSVEQALEEITAYSTGNSGISSLTVLGITLADDGVMSFDSSAFSSVTADRFGELLTFLGSEASGGFLKAAAGAIDGMDDETAGALTTSLSSIRSEITGQNRRIEEEQARIDDLAESLRERMAAADALIASLEQQVLYITNMFGAMRTASEGMN
jgi:flagellar hook-associated protein 2